MIDDTLIEAIRQATEGRYRLLAELGHDERRTAFLASESGSGRLTVLLLEEDEGDEQILSVADRLDGRVPGAPVLCPTCGDPGRAWGQPCPDCGAGTFGTDPATLGLTIGRVEEDVRAALPEGLTLLGSLPAEPEGAVFFAEDAERGVLAYVLTPADDDELHLALLWREDRPAAAVPPAPAAVELDPEPEPEPGIESDTLGAPPTDYQPPETPWDAPSRAAPLAAPSGGGRGLWLGLLAVGVVGAGAWLLLGGGRGGAEAEPLPPVAVAPRDSVPTLAPAAQPATVDTAAADSVPVPAPTVAETPAPRPQPPATGAVVIEGDLPPDARITVDGRVVGGRRIERAPGTYTLAISAPGYFPTTASYTVRAGGVERWTPTFRRLEEAPVEPETRTEPAAAAPEPQPATAAAASPREAIQAVLERYRAALESHDVERLRAAFFGIPASEEQKWVPFFRQFETGRFSDLRVQLTTEGEPAMGPDGERAEVDVLLSLRYTDPNGAPPGQPIPLRAFLRGGPQGWLLLRLDPR